VDARGEILELKTTINTMVDQLSSFAAEVTRVAREVGSEGRLGGQAEVEGVSGTWKRLTENVNELAGNLTRQVRAIAGVTSAVAEGDLTRSITVEASGEVAELKDNINAMVKSLRETTRANRDQDWLKSNLAGIAGLMQGRRDLAVVAELIMDELTPLVGAQYGAFFLAEDGAQGTELKLIASYGDPADPTRPRVFRLGQSLVGQAARSRRIIAVDDVPPGYVSVTSGLGSVAPKCLVVLPIVVEDQVRGVIELASVHRFTAVHRSFLEQLMETIGVNVNTIVANARTDELLGESQRLTVELRARQEELQRSNAELEEKAALLASQNRDIETKNLEIEHARQELEARAQQLALASQYKSEFLANMSHELRTPLNSLLILAQLLAQNAAHNLTPKQVEYAEVIHSAGSDLLQLINDILDLSKVEAGKMVLEPEAVPLPRLLEYLEATFRPLTGQKGLRFTITAAPGIATELTTDDTRLRQVLRNLLSNAVKFTESGNVKLAIEQAAPEQLPASMRQYGPALAFRVADTGIGIPEAKLESIFDAFQQADGTTSRRFGGTGLGLSISREIARLLGGAITAESTVGAGSVFTLFLPVAGADWDLRAGQDQGLGPTTPQRVRRLLIVEQQIGGLLSLLAQAAVAQLPDSEAFSIRVETATSVREATERATAESFHLAVLQLDLPDEGALRFLQALADDSDLRTLPVLAHHDQRLDLSHHRLLLAHAQQHPLELLPSLDDLRDRISLRLSTENPLDVAPIPAVAVGTGPQSRAAFPPDDGRLAGRTVLVVDDDPRNVFALTSMLDFYGVTVLSAGNGREGIEMLGAHQGIDLILMDVMMPEMDGYEAASLIRSKAEFAHLPIIAVTAKAMQGDREKSLAAGASDYVTKPVDAATLIDRVRVCLDR
jgi:signal transduction histidine kinase/CheY-like chemotaxis protein/HAMP domain-containing protein